jgi:ubiquinone/menaquinone biosynthesis C-methylase UbiE
MGLRASLFALTYDRMARKSEEAGVAELRRNLLRGASGNVLEIGAGTGLNLRFYDDAVSSLALTEPEPAMVRRLQRKARDEAPLAKVLRAPAEDLPFEEDTFDTVVSTLVLCGVDDQARALRELRRVLRPRGRLLFMEHVRAGDPQLARLQDRVNWVNRLLVGCHCNRATLASIEAEGFTVSELERTMLPKAPKFVRPLIIGIAT